MTHEVGRCPRLGIRAARVVAAIGVALPVVLGLAGATPGAAAPAAPDIPAPGEIGNDVGPAHVPNPYTDAQLYVDPEWSAMAAADGGTAIADQPTAVWLDSIASIHRRTPKPSGSYRSMGLVDHLDTALAQGADAIQLVLWNLPGRGCARTVLTGEIGVDELDRYRTEFIDPIAEILARPEYLGLRIITMIEPESLPNLVTSVGTRASRTLTCDAALASDSYVTGIEYALSRLQELRNVYTYLDAGQHAWIGWDDNFFPSARLLADTVARAAGGRTRLDGIIVNTAGYSALVEPFLEITDSSRMTKWIDWNRYVDELSFATAFRAELVALGLDPGLGILIDTSRNGWGGPDRPAVRTPGDTDEAVDASRIDRRNRPQHWCNQAGAGLGERPQADPARYVDAYVWAKPPGESDGAGKQAALDAGQEPDWMCSPGYERPARDSSLPTGALPDAPVAGAWFSTHFRELLANAHPPL